MATIVNKSEFTISVNPVGVESFLIGPGGRDDRLTDKQVHEWADRPHNKFVSAGLVLIRYDKNKPRAAPPAAPAVPAAPPVSGVATELGDLHWQKAVAAVEDINDLDVLEQLHTSENRPRVKSAIEDRMKGLQGGQTVRDAG